MAECTDTGQVSADEGIRQIRLKITEWFNSEDADPLETLVAIGSVVLAVYLAPAEAT